MDTRRSQPVLNRRGQALSEYAMLVAMVGMGLVVILGLFGRATRQAWQNSESKFADEPSTVAAAPSPAPAAGGTVVSGSAQPTPPPSSPPARPPKKDSSDSTGAAADSLGGPSDNPIGQAPEPGQEPVPGPRW